MIMLLAIVFWLWSVIGVIKDFNLKDIGECVLAVVFILLLSILLSIFGGIIIHWNIAYRETKLQERAMIIKNIEVACSGIDTLIMLNSKNVNMGNKCSEWIEKAKSFNNSILSLRKYNPIVYRLFINIFPVDENPIKEARTIPLIDFN